MCFANQPISLSCNEEAEILGFACYNTTAKNFFGPTHVLKSMRGKGIGKALLIASLEALKAEGYAYAIIGGEVRPSTMRKRWERRLLKVRLRASIGITSEADWF